MPFSNINGLRLNVPKSFEGILPVSPNTLRFDYEPYAFYGIQYLLNQSDIAFDIGVSYGVMSTLMAKLVGEGGRICSFEANPEVFQKANEFFEVNGVKDIIQLHNNLICDKSGENKRFFIIDGFNSVSSTCNPDILSRFKNTTICNIHTMALDDFCQQTGLIPSLIKLDIEGAEYLAIKGMTKTIREYMPDMQIETHYTKIDGIGGTQYLLLSELESFGYGIFDLCNSELINAEAYTTRYASKTGYILISNKFNNQSFVDALIRQSQLEIQRIKYHKEYKERVISLRNLVDKGLFEEALESLESLKQSDYEDSTVEYLIAFCLHNLNCRLDEAVKYYGKALDYGFDPFWVYYNRALLYLNLGKRLEAKEDLLRAQIINQNHLDINELLNSLS